MKSDKLQKIDYRWFSENQINKQWKEKPGQEQRQNDLKKGLRSSMKRVHWKKGANLSKNFLEEIMFGDFYIETARKIDN